MAENENICESHKTRWRQTQGILILNFFGIEKLKSGFFFLNDRDHILYPQTIPVT